MTSLSPPSPLARARHIQQQLPPQGLFAGKEWRIATAAFELPTGHVKLLERLGETLHKFNLACNLLYRHSVEGKQPAWIADLFDRGKPPELVEAARHGKVKGQVASVIRPDLVLTEEGFALTEIDSVPGGIGLSSWLNETYAGVGESVLGGATGMQDGFAQIFPEGDVVISEEAATYRPEMEYLVGAERVQAAEGYQFSPDQPVYRFFECFDWPQLASIRASYDPAAVKMTPRSLTCCRQNSCRCASQKSASHSFSSNSASIGGVLFTPAGSALAPLAARWLQSHPPKTRAPGCPGDHG